MAGMFGSGDMWMPPAQQQNMGVLGGARPNWASGLGIFGAALADAGAQFSGHPADAVNLQNQIAMQRQMAAQRALQSTPFNGDAAGYMQSLIQAGVPVETAIQAASGQRSLQGVKTLDRAAATAAGFKPDEVVQQGPDGQYHVAQASDMLSQGAIDQANSQKHITPLLPNDPLMPALNARIPGAVYGKDAAGNLVVNNVSGAKSQIAQQQDTALGYAQLNKPVEVGFGSALVDPKTHQVIYESAPDPAAVQTGIDYFKKFGQFPPNARSPAMQQAIMAGIHNDMTKTGTTMDDVANSKAAVHGQTVAAGGMARTQAQTAVNEGTVNNSINIVRKLLPTAASQGKFTDINAFGQSLARRTNDPNAVLLKNGIDSITNEYARVMTGSTSGSPSSDAARREAGERILLGYNQGTLDAVLNQMQQEMAGRSGAQASVLGNLTGGKFVGAPVPGQGMPARGSAANLPQKAPPGTTQTRVLNGKTYYLINGQWHQ